MFVHGHGWWDSPRDLRTTRLLLLAASPQDTPPPTRTADLSPQDGPPAAPGQPPNPPPKPGFPKTRVPC